MKAHQLTLFAFGASAAAAVVLFRALDPDDPVLLLSYGFVSWLGGALFVGCVLGPLIDGFTAAVLWLARRVRRG